MRDAHGRLTLYSDKVAVNALESEEETYWTGWVSQERQDKYESLEGKRKRKEFLSQDNST